MNEVIKAIKERRSIRRFKPDMPEKKDLDAVIEAGLYAASARGKQAPVIIAVTNKELREKLARANCKIGGWGKVLIPFTAHPSYLSSLSKRTGRAGFTTAASLWAT